MSSSKSSTVFILNYIVYGFINELGKHELQVPTEIIKLIIFCIKNTTSNLKKPLSTFEPPISADHEMLISLSFPESKINKMANIEIEKENSQKIIPVYLPYIIDKHWTIKQLKQHILIIHGIDPDLYKEYTLWKWISYINKHWKNGDLDPINTGMIAPKPGSNKSTKKELLYKVDCKGYHKVNNDKCIQNKLRSNGKCILSKDKPNHRDEGCRYAWKDGKKYYTRKELIKLWGSDLSEFCHPCHCYPCSICKPGSKCSCYNPCRECRYYHVVFW